MKAIRMKMPWRATNNNVTDCGVFCMRHMEPYFGETDKCQCGFKKNEVSLQKCLTLNITHINKKTNISIINLVFFYFSGQESVSCNESTILL